MGGCVRILTVPVAMAGIVLAAGGCGSAHPRHPAVRSRIRPRVSRPVPGQAAPSSHAAAGAAVPHAPAGTLSDRSPCAVRERTHRVRRARAIPGHPNIVMVLSDDQRAGTIAQMPNLMRLVAAHGTTFNRAYVTNAFCCPSRASILTGTYSHATGVWGIVGPHGGFHVFHDRSTFATWLHAAGYHTGLFGKYLNGYTGPYIPPGWDDWASFDGGYNYYGFSHYDAGTGLHIEPTSCYSTRYLGERSARFVYDAPPDQPLLLYYTPFAPHQPATPEGRYRHAFAGTRIPRTPNFNEAVRPGMPAYVRTQGRLDHGEQVFTRTFARRQLQSLATLDDGVADIVRALRATGRLHDTLFVYTSDNGVMWGAHHFVAPYKRLPYEEAIHVPLVVRYDPMLHGRPHTDDTHVVGNIDFAPTFAAAAGVHPTTHVDGHSLLPILDGARAPWQQRLLLEHFSGGPPAKAPSYCGVLDDHLKFVHYATGEEELYDLSTDPYELTNLAADPTRSGTVRRLRAVSRRGCRPVPPAFHW